MIYFDNAATTKVDEEVIADIVEALRNDWANPSSISSQGIEVRQKVEYARKQIADYINADPEEIIFVASGSEANSLAIRGFLDANPYYSVIPHSMIEHPSIGNTCELIAELSVRTKTYFTPFVGVDMQGLINLDTLKYWLSEYKSKCLVSIMMGNNEIGTVQDIKRISQLVHNYNGVFHTDAVQAFGQIPIDVKEMGIDMMSVSGHKFGCPKGVGFLYKRKDIEIYPLINGGSQEMNLRAGTENVPYIIAMGNQVERMSKREYPNSKLANYLYEKICDEIGYDFYVWLNGSIKNRLPNNLSLTFSGVNAEALITLLDMKGVQVSAGSACCAGDKEPSRVLKAIGLSDEEAFSTIRISLAKDTTKEECDEFVRILGECLESLKIME